MDLYQAKKEITPINWLIGGKNIRIRGILALLVVISIVAGTAGIGQVLADDQQSNSHIANDQGNQPVPAISNGSPMVLSLDSHTYYPNDNVGIYVYNATSPLVSIIDPSGNAYNVTMLEVNGSAYSGEYALTSGIVLSNYTVTALDNATGAVAEDQFEVVSRPVTITPTPGNSIAPADNGSASPLYLYLTVARHDYYPGDHVIFTVDTNAGIPSLIVKDPSGKVTPVSPTVRQDDTYSGDYWLNHAIVLGNYSVTASLNCNGTYENTTAYFNVSMGDSSGQNGVDVRFVAYDPVQKAFVINGDMASNTSETPEKRSMTHPRSKGWLLKA